MVKCNITYLDFIYNEPALCMWCTSRLTFLRIPTMMSTFPAFGDLDAETGLPEQRQQQQWTKHTP